MYTETEHSPTKGNKLMRYTVRKSVVQVIGTMWMPSSTGATSYDLTASDVDNARDDSGAITRESVARWLDSHAGDFSGVLDFNASLEDGDTTVDLPWADEDSELTFNGCMFPEDDDS